MSERRECFCGRRTVFEFGLTDDDGNAHTWRFWGKDEDGQGLDVNTLLSERMEQVERAEQAEAAIARVREFLADKDEGLTDEARAQGHFILVDTDSVRRALEGDSDG